MTHTFAMMIEEQSQAGELRRRCAALCRSLDFSETDSGKAATIATELATNLVRHVPGGGRVVVRSLLAEGNRSIELLCLDKGPGIRDLGKAVSNGYSTGGGTGAGLGAVMRLSAEFDIYTQVDRGTAVLSRVWPERPAALPPLQLGAVCLPASGEDVCGDAWAVEHLPSRTIFLVADGLGHGPDAAIAANTAVGLFRKNAALDTRGIVEAVHAGLQSTRGAAVAVADIDPQRNVVTYTGVGNISARIVADGGERNLVSHNGTAGAEARKIQEFTYPWHANALLVMHSDGLARHWDLADYPGLGRKHPSLVAGVLLRDFTRGRDDVTVLAVKRREAGP